MVTRTSHHQPESPRAKTNPQAHILALVFPYLPDFSNMHNHAILWIPSAMYTDPVFSLPSPSCCIFMSSAFGLRIYPLIRPFIYPPLQPPFLVYQHRFADSTNAPPPPPSLKLVHSVHM